MQIYDWKKLTTDQQNEILLRPKLSVVKNIQETTQNIIDEVKQKKDKALFEFTAKFDRVSLSSLEVTRDEIINAFKKISPEAKRAIEFAESRIQKHHLLQFPHSQSTTSEGITCERQPRPIESVGLYVPGGTAPLVSTLLMLAVPAKIAGCSQRILCTPANQSGDCDPHLLVAASLCDVHHIYKVGGAQAIAAMAYGTETIPKVNKIFGPGNAWVTQAKMNVAQDPQGATIDMPAGPSELMVFADNTANVAFVAADLLSQAEHGIDSQVILVALSHEFAEKVATEVNAQLEMLPRKDIARQSLTHARIIVINNFEKAISIINRYAPEHLILQFADPDNLIADIQNAGAIFVGPWSAETMGDYINGSNHVLPTYGYAKSISGLSVNDFMKFISVQLVSAEGLKKIGPYAEILAEIEGLHAHKNAVSLRLRELQK